ncbi:hypothetical protein HZA97_05255 [Candidatus Woesearchaeota archaeon]|nr:hypothetical protein [Candidatus Woesearchaeota archaeon]
MITGKPELIPRKANGTPLEDYNLLQACKNNDFLLIDTCAATDVSWISLPREHRVYERKFNIKYSPPLEQRIDYNALIGILFASKPLFTTPLVLQEIKDYAKHQKAGLLSSIDQIIHAIEQTPKLISLDETPEFEMYVNDLYFQKLSERNGLSDVDFNLLATFFATLHYTEEFVENCPDDYSVKGALITNDRGILETYKHFGYKLPGNHRVYSALFGQKYTPTIAGK